jgi:hypothetical protein
MTRRVVIEAFLLNSSRRCRAYRRAGSACIPLWMVNSIFPPQPWPATITIIVSLSQREPPPHSTPSRGAEVSRPRSPRSCPSKMANATTPIEAAVAECISDDALIHLKSYKYSSVDKSPVSHYILRPYVRAPGCRAFPRRGVVMERGQAKGTDSVRSGMQPSICCRYG